MKEGVGERASMVERIERVGEREREGGGGRRETESDLQTSD